MDWSDEHRYDVLIANSDVKRRITEAGAGAHAPVSGEEVLQRFAVGISRTEWQARTFIRGVDLGERLGHKMHFRVIRKRHATGLWPVGEAIVAVLCSMARNSQTVRAVHQRDDGCDVTAQIPSDHRSNTGFLEVSISREPVGGSAISATARSLGQLLDWGKARNTLLFLFADVDRFTASWGSVGQRS